MNALCPCLTCRQSMGAGLSSDLIATPIGRQFSMRTCQEIAKGVADRFRSGDRRIVALASGRGLEKKRRR
jgi:hypothetical protein